MLLELLYKGHNIRLLFITPESIFVRARGRNSYLGSLQNQFEKQLTIIVKADWKYYENIIFNLL